MDRLRKTLLPTNEWRQKDVLKLLRLRWKVLNYIVVNAS
jgi:hypothetical protein